MYISFYYRVSAFIRDAAHDILT